jgi:olfactory receptor
VYLVRVLGNLLIIRRPLTTRPYVFLPLKHVMGWDLFIFTTNPMKSLHTQPHRSMVSFVGCLVELSLFILFWSYVWYSSDYNTLCFFMSFFIVLYYLVIIHQGLLRLLSFDIFLVRLLVSQKGYFIILQFTNFKNVEIENFFCDTSHALNLSCVTYSVT